MKKQITTKINGKKVDQALCKDLKDSLRIMRSVLTTNPEQVYGMKIKTLVFKIENVKE